MTSRRRCAWRRFVVSATSPAGAPRFRPYVLLALQGAIAERPEDSGEGRLAKEVLGQLHGLGESEIDRLALMS